MTVPCTCSAASGLLTAYDRRHGLRLNGYEISAVVSVSVVDKRRGKVLVDNRIYRANAPFVASDDITTAQRDASGRVMDDIARQVVDDVLALKL